MNNVFEKGVDHRVRCYRPDGTCYAIVSPRRWAELRKQKKLDAWLQDQRESGVVIDEHQQESE